MYQLLTSTGLVYFIDLCVRYSLPLWEVFRYLQIKNFLLAHLRTFVVSFPMRQFESKCLKDPHALGLISLLYNGLLLQYFSDLPSYVRKWASDLCVRLETTDWSQIWKSTKSCSVSVIVLEANYKVLMRWYLVPARIGKFFSSNSSLFLRLSNEGHPPSHLEGLSNCRKILEEMF